MNLMEAIAREEGYYVLGGRANRNNNPGDIEYGQFASTHGATRIELLPAPRTPRFAYFPDVKTGFEAMRQLLILHYKGMTVSQALNKYAPPVENETNSYIANVCKWVGCTPDTIVDSLLGE